MTIIIIIIYYGLLNRLRSWLRLQSTILLPTLLWARSRFVCVQCRLSKEFVYFVDCERDLVFSTARASRYRPVGYLITYTHGQSLIHVRKFDDIYGHRSRSSGTGRMGLLCPKVWVLFSYSHYHNIVFLVWLMQRWNRVVRVTGQCPIHMTRSFDPDSVLQKCTFCLVHCHCQRVWLKRHR